jgi:hypothetical protein
LSALLKSMNRQPSERLGMVSGEYDVRKAECREAGWPTRVTIAKIEKEFKLKPKSLTWYRANHYSRRR